MNKEELLKELQETEILETGKKDSESFFKSVLDQLMNLNDMSTKTEYLNVNENFAGAKLHFLAKHGNIPYLLDFINIFEQKRVSLQRKGRKEILIALKERQQEIERERQVNVNKLMGY